MPLSASILGVEAPRTNAFGLGDLSTGIFLWVLEEPDQEKAIRRVRILTEGGNVRHVTDAYYIGAVFYKGLSMHVFIDTPGTQILRAT